MPRRTPGCVVLFASCGLQRRRMETTSPRDHRAVFLYTSSAPLQYYKSQEAPRLEVTDVMGSHVEILEKLRGALQPQGFEVHPFQVSWYNGVLEPVFHLSYPPDTLAFVVLSAPAMFEKSFKPFLAQHKLQSLRDPIDQCVSHCMALAQERFSSHRIDVIYDYELHPNRRPKVLMQTAAHVSGAAYYYQRKDVESDPWGGKKMFGVCIHPRFGGWFAIRAVLVFPGVRAPGLEQTRPIDCVPSREDRISLLENFNFNWRDGRYRDVLPAEEKYSAEQTLYFATPPAERLKLLELWGQIHPIPPC